MYLNGLLESLENQNVSISPKQQWLNETLAILVLYKTILNNSATFISIGKALEVERVTLDLFIYDNSPLAQPVPDSSHWKINYYHDPTNPGVSKAYNEGCKKALRMGKKWLWLLDQDDVFDAQSITQYYTTVSENSISNIFAPVVRDQKSVICSPFRMRYGGGWRIKEIEPGTYPLSQFLLINSGLFISVSAFGKVEGYEENFPLDFSDLDFIKRLRKEYDRFVVIPTTIQHSLAIHSSQTMEAQLARFHTYVKAAKLFRKKYYEANPSILFRSFVMAIKFSLRHFSLRFIKEYFIIWY